jgi:hypothetical protein
MIDKQLRDYAVLNTLHPGSVPDPTVEETDTPSFDGGARAGPDASRLTPGEVRIAIALRRVSGPHASAERGWVEYEIGDGAEMFFGKLGDR